MNIIELQKYLLSLGISTELQGRILKSVIALTVLLLIKQVASKVISNRVKDEHVEYRWQKINFYTFYILLLLIVGGTWYSGIQSLATFLGLLTAGLAVAFKDYLINLAGWFYIFWKEPFKVGHRIEIGNVMGDIIDLGALHISLLEVGSFSNSEQPTGRIVFLPNSQVFTNSIANYDISFPYIWHEVDIVVTFESDWEKAKTLIKENLKNNSLVYDEDSLKKFRKESKQFLLPKLALDPIIFTSVADHGVRLSARFVCEPRNRRTVEQKIWEDLLKIFRTDNTIDFAYPTTRFYDNKLEGKRGDKTVRME